MGSRKDLRRQDRQSCSQVVTVMWRDACGDDKFTRAQALDVSEVGLRLRLQEALPFQSCVALRATKLGIHGQALVRHCSHLGTSYAIGLQFAGELRWRPTE